MTATGETNEDVGLRDKTANPTYGTEWPAVKLAECAAFQEGYVNPPQTVASHFGDEIKWLRAVDLNDGFVFETSRRLSQTGFESAGKSALLFEPNTLAISKSGTIGRLGILKDRMCGNRAVINIKVDETKCNSRFIFYILLTHRQTIENLAIGSVQKNLYTSALGKLEFVLPPKPMQDDIASVLGTLDDKIELNRRMNETLEAIARAIFKSWFVDFDPVRAKASGEPPESICRRLRLTPDLLAPFPDRLVDSELGEIPEGWDISALGEHIEIFDSKRIPLSNREREVRRGQYPYYGAASVMDYVDDYIFDGIYVLMGEDGSVVNEDGSPVIQYVWGKFWVNNHAHVLLAKAPMASEHLLLLLKQTNIAPFVTGAVQAKLSQGNLRRIPFVSASDQVVEEFSKLIGPVFDLMRSRDEETRTLANTRDALLPKLLSGELRMPEDGSNIEACA